jgi:hypothetical protein
MNTIESQEYAVLQVGTVLPNGRTVMECSRKSERVEGDSYASWVAVCYRDDAYHPYAVWTVVATPKGWHSEQGDYSFTYEEALVDYKQRGGN